MHPILFSLAAAIAALPAAVAATERSGADVYAQVCQECHATGKLGAPLFGDAKAWGKLVREGLNDLVPAALSGIRQMPPKGGNPQLSDLEVARGVVHMANAGGGRFKDPTPADVARWRKKADARNKP
jgi:cytochrome c5